MVTTFSLLHLRSHIMRQVVCTIAIHCKHSTTDLIMGAAATANHVMWQEVCMNAIHRTHSKATARYGRTVQRTIRSPSTEFHSTPGSRAHGSLMPCLIKGAIRQQPYNMQVLPMGLRLTPKSQVSATTVESETLQVGSFHGETTLKA